MLRRPPIKYVLPVIICGTAFARLVSSNLVEAAATPSISKQAAVASIAQNVLLPGYADLTARSAALAEAADALAAAPSAESLKSAQQAWVQTLLAWRRTQSFIRGPVTDLNALGRLQFWPLRPQSIDKVLNDTKPFSPAYVDALGATAIGLFPLEKLLFNPGNAAAVLASLSGSEGARRRAYVSVTARDLETRVRAVEKAWQGPGGYGARFANGGQDSINLLINDMLQAIELGAQGRLLLIKEWNSARVLKPEFVEAGLSAASQQAMLSLLTGAEERFNGGEKIGLDDYLRAISPATADRVKAQFRKTIAAVTAINMPLENATAGTHALIEQAHTEARTLEIILKTEVASALGVTLTFRSTDGD